MKRTAVLFDLDGLMVDTEPLSRSAWAQVLAPRGVSLTDELYGRMLGRRTAESAALVLAAHPLPLEPEELVRLKTEAYLTILDEYVPVMPGLWVLLEELERRSILWGVATSSPRRIAETILRRLSLAGICRALAGGDEVAAGKPAPDVYLLAARRLGVSPAACLAMEDSAAGCAAAAAAGMRVVAVPTEPTRAEPFNCAYRRYLSLAEVAADLDDLLK